MSIFVKVMVLMGSSRPHCVHTIRRQNKRVYTPRIKIPIADVTLRDTREVERSRV